MQMAMSGIKVEEECVKVYEELKLRKDNKFILYKMSDDLKKVQIDELGDKSQTYDDFLTVLKSKKVSVRGEDVCDARFAVVDVDFTDKEGKPQSKLVFIMWNPDNGPIKKKMLFASTKETMTKKLTGLAHKVEATEEEDIKFENVVEVFLK